MGLILLKISINIDTTLINKTPTPSEYYDK